MKRDAEISLMLSAQGVSPEDSPPDRWGVACNPALLSLAGSKSCLLLQGPVGPLFDRLALWLESSGTTVNRVVLQGGDLADTQRTDAICFAGLLSQWSEFLRERLLELCVDHIALFGQTRAHHRYAIDVAKSLGIQVVVFEEGYFRPGFVTMELNGVNAFSSTMDRYKWIPNDFNVVATDSASFSFTRGIQPAQSDHHYKKMVLSAISHYFAMYRYQADFPDYCHHRETRLGWYTTYWIRSWVKKYWNDSEDRAVQKRLISGSEQYFFVPLQCDDDSQIVVHSPFGNVAEFIGVVLKSFAKHCPPDASIMFKLHPNSRGGKGYRDLIMELALQFQVKERIYYITEGDAPILAEHSNGVVTVNSTVGIQALERGTPVIALGEAVFKRHGVAFMGELDSFWTSATRMEQDDVQMFLAELKNLTQVPCCLYADRSEPLGWSELL